MHLPIQSPPIPSDNPIDKLFEQLEKAKQAVENFENYNQTDWDGLTETATYILNNASSKGAIQYNLLYEFANAYMKQAKVISKLWQEKKASLQRPII